VKGAAGATDVAGAARDRADGGVPGGNACAGASAFEGVDSTTLVGGSVGAIREADRGGCAFAAVPAGYAVTSARSRSGADGRQGSGRTSASVRQLIFSRLPVVDSCLTIFCSRKPVVRGGAPVVCSGATVGYGGTAVDRGSTAVVRGGEAVVRGSTAVLLSGMAVVRRSTAVVLGSAAVVFSGTTVVFSGTAFGCGGTAVVLGDTAVVYN